MKNTKKNNPEKNKCNVVNCKNSVLKGGTVCPSCFDKMITPTIEKEEEKIKILCKVIEMVEEDPNFGFELMSYVHNGLINFKKKVDKRNSNIWLVVKNLKPEHLEEMKKLIIPEVFEDLGIK